MSNLRPAPMDDQELLDLIAEEAVITDKRVTRDMTLEELNIESLDVITILFEVEDRYGAVIETTDLEHCVTVGDVVDLLRSRLGAGQESSQKQVA